jgi:hypothetical protein
VSGSALPIGDGRPQTAGKPHERQCARYPLCGEVQTDGGAVQELGDSRRNHLSPSRRLSPGREAKAAVRAEVFNWGLGDTTVDPGETLLRLVTQSAARAERYAQLLEEAYEAAERLKQAHDAGAQIYAPGDELADTAETGRRDLDRIFNTGGVAALAGNTYGAAKDVGVYVTGEAIRGLADLEAKERERCANFATKADAAGLAERTVRIAERQGQLMVEMVQAALREVDLSPEQASAFKAALARQARELTASPVG